MRTAAAAAFLLLAACGESAPENGNAAVAPSGASRATPAPQAADGVERVACAVEGAGDFQQACVVERTTGPDGLVLTLRHPGGGFRRLRVTTDGRGVVAADGAESAAVRVLGDRLIEVAIGADRYRLPATVGK